ncbi:MAG: alpha-mannosidase [Verrucomicrobiota bacterium]|nr:alpha-mannosidase [Verrucomicrobiota bacterium]
MPPPNPLISLTPLRVKRGLVRLAEMIWHDERPLDVEATAPRAQHLSLATAQQLARRPVRPDSAWGRLFDQRWCRVALPPGPRRWLRWDEQGETTLYLDGVPFYGFDVAHRVCELPAGAREAWLECLCVQSALWHPDALGLSPGGNLFRSARLLRRDDEAWAAYHDLNCLSDYLLELRTREHPGVLRELNGQTVQPALTEVSPLYRRLLRGLDAALDEFDTRGVAALRRTLADVYREMRETAPLSRAALTGHSHLDLVWLWPEQTGEGKAVHTFANVNRLMALYPEFRFAYSQPASYVAVGRRAPALLRAVKARLRRGQWEATGGLYVESDSQLVCGEGLARSFVLGQAAFRRLTGRPSRVLWVPDLFGFSACLPQLMRLSGVDYFFTTKTTWNKVNRFPHSSFRWRGPGGHEVLGHVTQGVQFNNTVAVEQLRAASHQNQQADLHDEFLLPNGWGDGGGGPSEEMCERARRLAGLRGLPALHWDHPEAFFGRLARQQARLPAHDGEIYLEHHRGTFTTQSRVKAHFRALERALQLREAALVATGRAPDAELAHAWRRMVFAQFHDYVPGSSIPEVYQQGLPELAMLTKQLQDRTNTTLSSNSGDACLFNPLPLARRHLHRGRLLELPPLAGVRLADATVVAAPSVTVRGRTLGNGRVRVRVNARGHLSALSVDGRPVALAAGAGDLVLYPDQPANFGPWDIDRHSLALGRPARGPGRISTDAAGLTVTRQVGRSSTASIRYWLEPGSTCLRLTVELDWHEPDTLLKLHFPTAYRGREARCGTPFGSVLRPQLSSSPQVEGMWEWPMSRWAAVSDDGERSGLFVVTEAKYGLSCHAGNLGLSLLRTPAHVGYEEHAKGYAWHLSRIPRPAVVFTDLGRHRIELAVGHHNLTAPRAEQPAALAETLFTPVLPYRGRPLPAIITGFAGGDTLVPAWAQPLGRQRWRLRLHEVGGQRGLIRLRLAEGWTVRKTDLLGRPLGRPLPTGRMRFQPYEIISLECARR